MCVPPCQERIETRSNEPKQVCEFLGSLTRLVPTAIRGELWFACEGRGVSTGGRATAPHFF